MPNQSHYWSAAAGDYEADFIDPYRVAGPHPLLEALRGLGGERTVADLGCGVGPLLPFLAEHFRRVLAIDFAEGMLARARERCGGLSNVALIQRNFTDLGALAGQADVVVAVNSLVLPRLADLE